MCGLAGGLPPSFFHSSVRHTLRRPAPLCRPLVAHLPLPLLSSRSPAPLVRHLGLVAQALPFRDLRATPGLLHTPSDYCVDRRALHYNLFVAPPHHLLSFLSPFDPIYLARLSHLATKAVC